MRQMSKFSDLASLLGEGWIANDNPMQASFGVNGSEWGCFFSL